MVPSAQPVRDGLGTGALQVKHRACDECRSRKLACTKEPDGCDRCKREGIVCHYSAQKPMGRPRKWRNVQGAPEAPAAPAAIRDGSPRLATTQTNLATPVDDVVTMDLDPAALIDPSLDANVTDMSILDLLGPDCMSDQPFEAIRLPTDLPLEPAIWNLDVDYSPPPPAGHTSFPSSDLPSSQGTTPPEPDPIDPALSSTSTTMTATPATGGAPAPATAPAPPPPPDSALQPPACSCLAELYLAMDAIARLPTEVVPAVRVARGAARAAHNAIQCRVCSPPLHEPVRSPAAAFQNTMLLGGLLPCIADAYHRILVMVDAETSRAIATHSPVRFSLSQHGGIWCFDSSDFPDDSSRGPSTAAADAGAGVYENQVLEPAAWRLTVRALLKLDVYGVDCRNPGSGKRAFHQVGLRDLVAQMDERSRRRHAEIDAMMEAGLPPPTGLAGQPAHHSNREPQCRKVIAIAREAVEGLVIP